MIEFNPERLKEIRVARKMTSHQLAGELGVSKQAISKYECGKSIPQADAVLKMAKILKAPHSFFAKASLVLEKQSSILFFRTNASTPAKDIECASITSRWCYEILHGIHEFSDTLAANIPALGDELSIIDKAKALRKHWGLSTSPIENLTHVLEENGIVVATVAYSELHTDAYSQIINGIPIIIINGNRGVAVRQRFSLAHELGHLVLHSNLSETDFILRGNDIEKEAHLFANSFLFPPDSSTLTDQTYNLKHFLELKKKWKVSIAAIMYHYINTNANHAAQLEKERNRFYKKFGKRFEPLDDVIPSEIPTYLSKNLKGIIKDESGFEKFYDIVRLPIDDIEMLSGLAKGYLSQYYVGNTDKALPEGANPYEQLTLFGMEV